jgi:hypothetical protein
VKKLNKLQESDQCTRCELEMLNTRCFLVVGLPSTDLAGLKKLFHW